MQTQPLSLTVNGEAISESVEPRTHLADFLREKLLLTGTHLGCEHGVCGACTVLMDDMPVRSCINFAVACDGRAIRTIEGFDDDPVMQALRAAFTAEHALQCGYCTPGMLVTARDIVLRLPDADDALVREELAGNLCRCTGYTGIVRAIRKVLDARRAELGIPDGQVQTGQYRQPFVVTGAPPPKTEPVRDATPRPQVATNLGADATVIEQAFTVPFAVETVWEALGDLERVAPCLPGAVLESHTPDGALSGHLAVRLGPIRARFAGSGTMQRDDVGRTATVSGSARDSLSGTTAQGQVAYQVMAEGTAAARVSVTLAFVLTGSFAQIARGGLVRDLAGRMTQTFADNLQALLSGAEPATNAGGELRASGLLLSTLWARIRALFGGRS